MRTRRDRRDMVWVEGKSTKRDDLKGEHFGVRSKLGAREIPRNLQGYP